MATSAAAARRVYELRAWGRKYIHRLKTITPCTDCGVSYPSYVMDFDHVEGRGDKAFNVSQVSKWTSKGQILKEIAKCEIVCSNCHRQRTYDRKMPLTFDW